MLLSALMDNTNGWTMDEESAAECHAEAHPVCERCGATTCTWRLGCDCNPAPVYVEGLPFCVMCAEAVR